MNAKGLMEVLVRHAPADQEAAIPTSYLESPSGLVLAMLGAVLDDTLMPAELLGEDADPAVVHILTKLRETELTGADWHGCLLAARMAKLEVINKQRSFGKALDRPWEYL